MFTLAHPSSFSQWRDLARQLLLAGIPPKDLLWQAPGQASLFSPPPDFSPKNIQLPNVSRAFLNLARTATAHRSNTQWPHLYSLLWRLTHGEPLLLALPTDPDVLALRALAKHISRDIHKMHAFVRFRKVSLSSEDRERFVAWFEPDHFIVPLAAPFFRKRFAGMDWSILTPDECIHWNGHELYLSEGVDKSRAPDPDAQDELWRAYYRSIFNPARLKVAAMQSEMPRKYWKNLPEAELIEGLISSSTHRTREMLNQPPSPEKPAPQNAYLRKLHQLDDSVPKESESVQPAP